MNENLCLAHDARVEENRKAIIMPFAYRQIWFCCYVLAVFFFIIILRSCIFFHHRQRKRERVTAHTYTQNGCIFSAFGRIRCKKRTFYVCGGNEMKQANWGGSQNNMKSHVFSSVLLMVFFYSSSPAPKKKKKLVIQTVSLWRAHAK